MAVSIHTDENIQRDVQEELTWDIRVRPNEIGVVVKDGIVSLTGWVESYLNKTAAEEDAHRVSGVRAVANDIEVHLPGSAERTDPDLAGAALNVLKWDAGIPTDKIDITVSHSWVTLKGVVNYYFQKRDAERAIERLSGVRGVSNLLTVKPQPAPQDLKSQIEKALVRNAQTDANRITVEVQGSAVILRGTVSSYVEKKAAEEAACSASGVTEVDNRMLVSLPV
jgi:osmotically-inducible protein OsmY